MTYEYHNNTIGVRVKWLIDEAMIITESNYKQLRRKGHLVGLRRGCKGTDALIEFESISRQDIKELIIQKAGHPKDKITKNMLEEIVQIDNQAAEVYAAFRKENGEQIPFETQQKYVRNASILNGIEILITDHYAKSRALGQGKTRMWQNVSKAVNNFKRFEHSIPGNYRRVKALYEKYKAVGYDALIHKGFNNDNSSKITGAIADWWIVHYSMPTKPMIPAIMDKYESIREDNGWPSLTESGVILWLNKPENKRLWIVSRHGKSEYNKHFGYKVTRDRSKWFPNAYWAIDGTKLDWIHYYDNDLKMAAKLKIDPVFDVHSEKIIGWSYSTTENHIDHFKALKSAVATTGARPFLITYDGQSGHTTTRMQDVYTNLVAKDGGVHYKHQAYRSSSPVEQIFSRFQQQILNQFWFSDKQGVRTRSMNSQPNMEFIKKNKHLLKSKEELIKAWEYAVKKWNESKHPKFKNMTRNEVFAQEAPRREEFDITEMVEVFWMEETKGNKYQGDGIKMKLSGETYEFEVRDKNGNIDLEFRRKYVGETFKIRYDPELINDGVQLWKTTADDKKTMVAIAQPKKKHESIPALMEEGDHADWFKDFQITEQEYARDLEEIERIQREVGLTPEELIEQQELAIKMGGDVPKEIRSAAEADSFLNRI